MASEAMSDGWNPMNELKREDGPVLGRRADGFKYGYFIGIKYDLPRRADWLLDEWNGRSVRCDGWQPLLAPPAREEAK